MVKCAVFLVFHPHFTAVLLFSYTFIHQLTPIHTHSYSFVGFMMPRGVC